MKVPWKTTKAIPTDLFSEIRQRAVFECCKWDPQVEDVATLSPFPLLLNHDDWLEISSVAEALAAETVAMETEVLRNPGWHKHLGLTRAIRSVLAELTEAEPGHQHVRVMRFDFHFTTDGWKITEANTDVPGGFVEASGFTSLIHEHFSETSFLSPADLLCKAIREQLSAGGTVALVHSTAFTDDRQVMVFLARKLEQLGLKAVLTGPDHVRWSNDKASIESEWYSGPVDFVFRFFPAEWLPNLQNKSQWIHFFEHHSVPLCNPAIALISQSKRLPLIWKYLTTPVPNWRRYLPETFALSEVDWMDEREWVLKPALGRVGESIGLHQATEAKDWKAIRKSARKWPNEWIAQRRFESVPLTFESRSFFPCLGVYTIDGKAAGIYGRISENQLINFRAQDIAVLIADSHQKT